MRTLIIVISLAVNLSYAQWNDSAVVVCDTNSNAGIYTLPRIAADGKGGAYICWRDIRNGYYDIYAQRVDSTGRIQWPRNGVPVVQAPYNQDFPRIISDGRGGAFIAWEDDRSMTNTFVYVQRVDREGNGLWQLNGVQAAETAGLFITIAPDGVDGVVLGWSTVADVFVQHLDHLGNRMWGDSGVQLTSRPQDVYPGAVAIASDGEAGAIVAWVEGNQVYVQRIDSSGESRWPINGILLSDGINNALPVAICADLNGGAIVNWSYSGAVGGVQRINHSGQTLWGAGGLPLTQSGAGGGQRNTSDEQGGAFIGQGLRIHHLNGIGTKIWGDSGVAFISTLGVTNSSQVYDGHQGVFNFSEFFQNGLGIYIQAQWIDSTGRQRFSPDGKRVSSIAGGPQFWPNACTDGRVGALVCWNDFRRGYSDVYIARVDTGGTVTHVHSGETLLPLLPVLNQNYPNPFNPETTISFSLPAREFVRLKVFDLLGREMATLVDETLSAGLHSVRFVPAALASGIYFYSLMTKQSATVRKMLLLH